jgi:hypothetical protein
MAGKYKTRMETDGRESYIRKMLAGSTVHTSGRCWQGVQYIHQEDAGRKYIHQEDAIREYIHQEDASREYIHQEDAGREYSTYIRKMLVGSIVYTSGRCWQGVHTFGRCWQ